MPAQTLQCEAFILAKRSAAEAFQGYSAFSAEHGSLFLLQRLPRKSAPTTTSLDLFDEASLCLESSNQGRSWFVQEVRIITRHPGIGGSYETLRLASAFAAVIARNPVDADSRTSVAELFRATLAAFASAARPDIVYFKGLYRFARDEGYPLKEHWFSTLPTADRALVVTLVNQPLAVQSAAAPEVARLQHRLDDYLRGHTEILLD